MLTRLVGLWLGLVCGVLGVLPAWSQTAQLVNGNRTHAGATNYGITTGTGSAYVLTLNKPIPGYAEGSCYLLEIHAANTGTATLDVNGKGAKTIFKYVSGASTALGAGDFGVGQVVEVCYDGVNMQAQLGGGGGGGLGDIGTVGSCQSADCFTPASPSDALTFKNATSGTVRLETVPGALSTNVARLKAETGSLCTDASVCTGYQPFFNLLTNHAQLKRDANDFVAFPQKAVPVAADKLLIEDSAEAWAKKWVDIGSLPSGGVGGPGDVEAVGTCGTGPCFTSGNPSASLFLQAAAAPGAPAAGSGVFYYDTTNLNLSIKTAGNIIKHGVQTKAPVTNEFLTAIGANGLVTSAQPTFANLAPGTAACSQLPALTGPITTPPGSCATTLASIPAAVSAAGSIIYTAITAPVAPGAGFGAVYYETTNLNLAVKTTGNVVKHMVQTKAQATNEFVTAIGANGLVASAQPTFGNIFGSLACGQHPALLGDVTTPPNSCATTVANLPTAVPAAGSIVFTAITAPGNPAPGKGNVYFDSTSKNLAVKDDVGLVKHGVQTTPPVANQFVTGVNAAGQLSLLQPDFGALTGTSSVATTTNTLRLSNKQVNPVEVPLTIDGGNVAINVDLGNIFTLDAIPGNIRLLNPTGTGGNPVCSQDMTLRLKSTSPRTLTWGDVAGSNYHVNAFPLPTVTTGNGVTENHHKFRWNCLTSKWVFIATDQNTGSATGYANLPLTGIKLHPTMPTGPSVAGPTTIIWFDQTSTECVLWEWTIPGDYVGSPVLRLWYTLLSDNISSHSAQFDVQVWALKVGENVNIASFDPTINHCDDANIPVSAGTWNDIACALTAIDGAVANDPVQFQICSDVAGTWEGDLGLIRARFEYAK